LTYCDQTRRQHPGQGSPRDHRQSVNTSVDASYLADAIVLLRYYEAKGEGGGQSR
jgi:hypothetical protein